MDEILVFTNLAFSTFYQSNYVNVILVPITLYTLRVFEIESRMEVRSVYPSFISFGLPIVRKILSYYDLVLLLLHGVIAKTPFFTGDEIKKAQSYPQGSLESSKQFILVFPYQFSSSSFLHYSKASFWL